MRSTDHEVGQLIVAELFTCADGNLSNVTEHVNVGKCDKLVLCVYRPSVKGGWYPPLQS